MRSASIVCCVLAILSAATSVATRAETPGSGTGPVYSIEALRAFDLFGVHLGMRRDEVHKALQAAGLKPDGIKDRSGLGMSEGYSLPAKDRAGVSRTVGVVYQRWPGRARTVSSISYTVRDPSGTLPSLEQRRAELVRRFGPPSYWSHWEPSEREGYAAAYVPLTALIEPTRRDAAISCMVGWNCIDGKERAECRSKMKEARVPIVQVLLSPSFDQYSLVDYETEYAVLSRRPEFRSPKAWDLCPAPRRL